MKNLKNGIVFLVLAFFLELPNITLRLLGIITYIEDSNWLANALAIISIIGVIFYITGILCMIRFLRWRKKQAKN